MTTGVFNTSQITTDLARKSFAAMMIRYQPNGTAPLFGISGMLPSETAVQTTHGYFSKTMLFPQLTLSSSATSTDTTLNVTSTSNVLPGMLMQVDTTLENIIVNNIISGNQVAVTRGVGSAAAAIANSVNLWQIGNAYEESSTRPQALSVNPVQITNLTQIFRNTWAISDSARATQVIAGETNVAENRQDCAGFHAKDIETALLFGKKSSGIRNGQPFRTMDGLVSIVGNLSYYPSYYVAANINTAGATTNYTQLEGFLDPTFNQTTDPKIANERLLFCGGKAKTVLNNIGRLNGQYQLVDGQTNFGLQFSTFKTSRGTFRVIEHPLFNSNASWAKMAIAVDMSSFRVAYLGDRKTQSKDFNAAGENCAQDNGIDAVGGTLTTEMTCLVKNPPANAIIYNLTGAAVG